MRTLHFGWVSFCEGELTEPGTIGIKFKEGLNSIAEKSGMSLDGRVYVCYFANQEFLKTIIAVFLS